MHSEFWHERWRNNQIGFHQPVVHRMVERHLARLELGKGRSVFVPLCGKSLDMVRLRETGAEVVGVELSAIAVQAFFAEQGIAVSEREQGAFALFSGGGYRLWVGDYFSLSPAEVGAVSAVYDRAALIALPEPMRERYARHLASLVAGGVRVLLVTHEYPAQEMAGPPFSVTESEVRRLFGSTFEVEILEQRDVLDEEARLRARGLTRLLECAYLLTRR